MIFPAITTTRDSLGRLRYWLFTSRTGWPRIQVAGLWANLLLRLRLVVDARPKEADRSV